MEEELARSATLQLFQYGVLGVFVVVFAVVIFLLWREGAKERKEFLAKIEGLQQLRIDDNKATQNQFVDLVRQSTTMMNNVATLLDSNKEAISEMKEAMREIAEDIRDSRRKP